MDGVNKPIIKRTYGSTSGAGSKRDGGPRKRPCLTYSASSVSSSSSFSSPPRASTSSGRPLLPARRCPVQRSQDEEANASIRKAARPGQIHRKGKGKGKGKKVQPQPQLHQMHLALSRRSINVTCAKCEMAYIKGSVEDEQLHAIYCKRASRGIEWPFKCVPGGAPDGVSKYCTVLKEGVVLGKGKTRLEGSIWMVEGAAEGALAKKLRDISDTVNQSISAISLSAQQAQASKYLLFVTADPSGSSTSAAAGKVVGCAIVERISQAFRVVSHSSAGPHHSGVEAQKTDDLFRGQEPDELLRIGEDEGDGSSGIFCSPQPLPALLGVHRIWTSPSFRRCAVSATLLDAVAAHAIYGRVLSFMDDKQNHIAFSQPSSAGKKLFEKWTGTNAFLVFVD